MIVQIYEIQDPREAEKCIELGVDRIGSILLSGDTWRDPSLKEVFRVTRGTAARNSLIPLFHDSDTLYRALDYYRPHFVHFCESLTDNDGREINLDEFIEFQADTKEKFPEIDVMRSVPIPQKNILNNFPTLKIAQAFEPVSDMFLTDTWLGKEPVEGYIGITGKTVDWETAAKLVKQSKIPVILAGGLSPDNVYRALMETTPSGADSCTQTNRVDGNGKPIRFRKDFRKVARFIKEVRKAEIAVNGKKGKRPKLSHRPV
jgi:phosphoribosylanthranilate isomerase